jgi:hypothetical protein
VAEFPLNELAIAPETLPALEGAGYTTILDIIDLDRGDLLGVEGIDEGAADAVLGLIDELTVEDTPAAASATKGPTEDELEEVAELLGLEAPKTGVAGADDEQVGDEEAGAVMEAGDEEAGAVMDAGDEEAGAVMEAGDEEADGDDLKAAVAAEASGAGEDEERGNGDEA